MKQYDYLIVGAGLYGAVFAHEAKKAGKKCLVIDKRSHIAGNIYTEPVEGINVHRYGAHIFHTNNKTVWQYVNQFAEFNRYTNSPVANYHGEIYNLPFNMNTFNKMWGVVTPAEAKARIEQQKAEAGITDPQNLEEQAISLVGTDIYEKLIKGYTGKQWGRPCTELPAFIIKRLPVRFTYDNNYFNALYQGIPNGGYTAMVENMLEGTEVRLNVDYLEYMAALKGLPRTEAARQIDALLERVSLTEVRRKKIVKLSGGMKRRVGIAQALLNDPEILILDEPTAGLDPGERVRFRNLLSEFAQERIVLISTHIVSDVEYIAAENAVMKAGKIIAQDRKSTRLNSSHT